MKSFLWILVLFQVGILGANDSEKAIKEFLGAVASGDTVLVKQWLDDGRVEDVDVRDDYGNTALMLAVIKGDGPMIDFLLEAGANVNAVGDNAPDDRRFPRYDSPLSLAVQYGSGVIVNTLINAGADVNFSAGYFADNPVLKLAAENADEDILIALINADATLVEAHGFGALFAAIGRGSAHIVEILINEGVDPDVDGRTYAGYTPLTWAASGGRNSIVDILVRAGADIDAKDGWGRTVQDYFVDGTWSR